MNAKQTQINIIIYNSNALTHKSLANLKSAHALWTVYLSAALYLLLSGNRTKTPLAVHPLQRDEWVNDEVTSASGVS